jgi:hypothetical protein
MDPPGLLQHHGTSQLQAGQASPEPAAPHICGGLWARPSYYLRSFFLKKFLRAKAGVISIRPLATPKGAIADHPSFLLMFSLNRKISPFIARIWALWVGWSIITGAAARPYGALPIPSNSAKISPRSWPCTRGTSRDKIR